MRGFEGIGIGKEQTIDLVVSAGIFGEVKSKNDYG